MTPSLPIPGEMPRRLGLPLDPVLQLWGGVVSPVKSVVFTGGPADELIGANPNRVALIIWPTSGVSSFAVAPAPGPILLGALVAPTPQPTLIHCRDYPGVTQGAWVVSGNAGSSIAVVEYSLQPWWSA